MPEKTIRSDGLPLLVRVAGPTTLPQQPPALECGSVVACLQDVGWQRSVFEFVAMGDQLGLPRFVRA